MALVMNQYDTQIPFTCYTTNLDETRQFFQMPTALDTNRNFVSGLIH